MSESEQKKHSAVARYHDAIARLKEEERRFETRQKIILGGALIALRRKHGDAGGKLLRVLIPYISDDDRSTVSDLLHVKERLPCGASPAEKAERRRDAINVAVARKQVSSSTPCSGGSDDSDLESGQARSQLPDRSYDE